VLEHIICENASSLRPISKIHYTDSVLNTVEPQAPIPTPIGPDHLTDALALVVHVGSYVAVAALPFENSLALFLVI